MRHTSWLSQPCDGDAVLLHLKDGVENSSTMLSRKATRWHSSYHLLGSSDIKARWCRAMNATSTTDKSVLRGYKRHTGV